jgi:acyl carrier protein
LDCTEVSSIDTLYGILTGRSGSVEIRNVPDARLQAEVKMLDTIWAPTGPRDAGELRAALQAAEGKGIEPEHLWSLGQKLDRRVLITPRVVGRYDVLFAPRPAPAMALPGEPDAESRPWTNTPARQDGSGKLIASLRKHLQEKVPAYMIPASFMLLDRMPLTQNGKVDRRALPPPGQRRPDLDESFVAPATALERRVAPIWQELLGLDVVGVDDNFFDLGGHSLLLVRLHSRLKEALNVDIQIVDLFRYPTISAFSRYVESHG